MLAGARMHRYTNVNYVNHQVQVGEVGTLMGTILGARNKETINDQMKMNVVSSKKRKKSKEFLNYFLG